EHQPWHRPRDGAGQLRDRQCGQGRTVRHAAKPLAPGARRQSREHHGFSGGLRDAGRTVARCRCREGPRAALHAARDVPGVGREEHTMATRSRWSPGPASWKGDLTPISATDWNYDRAAHLLSHAGFGGSPATIQKLADAGLDHAIRTLVHYESIPNPRMQPFVESGLWDPTLNGFPESRPEATDRAIKGGASMGIDVKPAGNRPVQPISDRFFYWLRATMLETRRLG